MTNTYNAALDAGNYSILSWREGQKDINFIRSVRAELIQGSRVIEPRSTQSPLIVLGNRRVHFGTTAYKYRNPVETVIDNKVDTELATLLLLSTLPPVGRETEYGVDLTFTLPDPYMEVETPEGTMTIGEVLQKAYNKTHKYIYNGIPMQVKVRAKFPQYEGHAAILKARQTGKVRDAGITLGIDIGGGTWNVLAVDETGAVIEQTSFDKGGGIALATTIAASPLMKARVGDELSLARIQDGIANGTNTYSQKGETWGDFIDEVVKDWAKSGLMNVFTRFKPYMADVTGMVFLGGNANLLRPYVAANPIGYVFDRPELANIEALRDSVKSKQTRKKVSPSAETSEPSDTADSEDTKPKTTKVKAQPAEPVATVEKEVATA